MQSVTEAIDKAISWVCQQTCGLLPLRCKPGFDQPWLGHLGEEV